MIDVIDVAVYLSKSKNGAKYGFWKKLTVWVRWWGTITWYIGTLWVRLCGTAVRYGGTVLLYGGTVLWYKGTVRNGHMVRPYPYARTKKKHNQFGEKTTNSIDCVVFFLNLVVFFWYAPSFVVYHVYLVSCTTRALEPVPCVPSYSTTVPYHRAVP